MKRLFASAGVALLLAARGAPAQGLVVDWSQAAVSGGRALPGAGPGGATALELRATAQAGTTFHLATINDPPVATPAYAVAGAVRYEGVEGQGYLEMWSVFPDGQRFFSRTLAPTGTLAALHGDADWRRFELPFVLNHGAVAPSHLEINVVLPGRGTVWVGPLHLERYEPGAAATPGAWWSERAGARLGGVAGSLIGLAGAMIGVLAALGRGRRVALGLLAAMVVVGAALLALAATAAWSAQPSYVVQQALLGGGLLALLGVVLRPTVRRRYAAVELRKIQAMDAGGLR